MRSDELRYLHKANDMPAPSPPGPAEQPAGRRLIVSNSPEKIAVDPTAKPTLYKYEFSIPANDPQGFLVWPWHKNGLTEDLEFQIFASLAGPAPIGTVLTDRKQEWHNSNEFGGDLELLGRCIAKIQYHQSFGPAPGDLPLSFAETALLPAPVRVSPGETWGGVFQFRAQSTSPIQLRIRIACRKLGGSWGSWSSEVADHIEHICGKWLMSSIVMPWPDLFQVGLPYLPLSIDCTVLKRDGSETSIPNGFYRDLSDPEALNPNRGGYGATIIYSFACLNSDSEPRAVMVYLVGYDDYIDRPPDEPQTGFWGAAQLVVEPGYEQIYPGWGVPRIRENRPEHDFPNIVPLHIDAQRNFVPIWVPAGGTRIIRVAMASGGAAALPT
ncbi:MAG: hypothetical protein WAO58_06475 [Fimbriimonadaceae bacterium]